VEDTEMQTVQVQAPARRTTADTPARWERAIERAFANGVEPLQVAGTGEWVVTSASRVSTVYRTDGRRCECEAALAGDPVCQHRAAVRYVLGWLSTPEAAPSCRFGCGGRGYHVDPDGRAAPERCPCRDGERLVA